ncbi:hypothetical protein M434DRAFT_31978 [Hypoxylon sp. CO27-5]|nr:hypothetical protein M434DRAFT_31978 [Hypoxylon sp. CO27-5]
MYRRLKLITLALALPAHAIPDPIICEDTLDGSPPFNSNDVPCLLGCGVPVAVPTGTLLPGSVNVTDIPYCQLNCVHDDATPSQSAAAPDCYQSCRVRNQATPENIGWCMYCWVTSTIGSRTVTFRPFTQPPEWQSCPAITAPPSASSTPALGASSSEGSLVTQEAQVPTSLADAESAVGTGTQGQSSVSPTPTGAGSRLSRMNLMRHLSAIGCLIMVVLI